MESPQERIITSSNAKQFNSGRYYSRLKDQISALQHHLQCAVDNDRCLTCPSAGLFLVHHLLMAKSTSALPGARRACVRENARNMPLIVDEFVAVFCEGVGLPRQLGVFIFHTVVVYVPRTDIKSVRRQKVLRLSLFVSAIRRVLSSLSN
jgi:hypothetical protein